MSIVNTFMSQITVTLQRNTVQLHHYSSEISRTCQLRNEGLSTHLECLPGREARTVCRGQGRSPGQPAGVAYKPMVSVKLRYLYRETFVLMKF